MVTKCITTFHFRFCSRWIWIITKAFNLDDFFFFWTFNPYDTLVYKQNGSNLHLNPTFPPFLLKEWKNWISTFLLIIIAKQNPSWDIQIMEYSPLCMFVLMSLVSIGQSFCTNRPIIHQSPKKRSFAWVEASDLEGREEDQFYGLTWKTRCKKDV